MKLTETIKLILYLLVKTDYQVILSEEKVQNYFIEVNFTIALFGLFF